MFESEPWLIGPQIASHPLGVDCLGMQLGSALRRTAVFGNGILGVSLGPLGSAQEILYNKTTFYTKV